MKKKCLHSASVRSSPVCPGIGDVWLMAYLLSGHRESMLIIQFTCRLAIPGSFFLVSEAAGVGGKEYRLTYPKEKISASSIHDGLDDDQWSCCSMLISELSLCE